MLASTLMRDRAPVMYDFEKCPRCEYAVPATQLELVNILSANHYRTFIDPVDEWYCVYCDYCFAQWYRIEDVLWYQPSAIAAVEQLTTPDIHDDDWGLEYYLCCQTYADICLCDEPVSFDDTLATLSCKGIYESDFYARGQFTGVDCTSCTRMGTETCQPFLNKLREVTFNPQPLTFEADTLLTPCHSYTFDRNNTHAYHFGSTTPQAVAVQYPEIRKIHNNA
jgi:hypothetical protein